MDDGISLIFVIMIFVVMFFVGVAYAATHVIGFVVTTIGRVFAGLGRLVFGKTRRERWAHATPHEMDGVALAGGECGCPNALCLQLNLPAARFCARCGQRLA